MASFILLRLIIPLGGFEAFSLLGSAFTLYKISESFLLIMNGPDHPLVSLSETFFFLEGVKMRHFVQTLNSSGAIPLYALERWSMSFFQASFTD